MTGHTEWGLLRNPSGRIVAVYSLAEGQPIKREGFDPSHPDFDNVTSYAQWRFGALPVRRQSAP